MALLSRERYGEVDIIICDATPEGDIAAPAGSMALSTEGVLYTKGSGVGNTGWAQPAEVIGPTEHFIPRFDADGNLVNTAIKVDTVLGGNPVWPGTLRIYAAGYSGFTLLDVIDGDVVLGNTSQNYAHFNDNYFSYKQATEGPPVDLLYYQYDVGFFIKHNITGDGNGRMIYTNGSYEAGIGDIDNVTNGTKVLVDISSNTIEIKAASLGFYDKAPIERPVIPATPTAQDIADVLVALGLATQAP